ncbi:hypothetical protein EON67_12110 [archaeon]|nr:MAG: hypothetical protein EON67_12110 [archaeon]
MRWRSAPPASRYPQKGLFGCRDLDELRSELDEEEYTETHKDTVDQLAVRWRARRAPRASHAYTFSSIFTASMRGACGVRMLV